MPQEKLRVPYTVVCEGKYDKIKLGSVIDANIVTTDGFGLFNDSQKRRLLRRIAENGRLLLLTDPDGGGAQIRGYLTGCLPSGSVIQLYVPRVPGKEKRKTKPSKAGTLGVEGIDADVLRKLFAPYASDEAPPFTPATKADFYELGLSGGENSSKRRDSVAAELGLPPGLTSNALLAAINAVGGKTELLRAAELLEVRG